MSRSLQARSNIETFSSKVEFFRVGYDLHITRAKSWSDSAAHQIAPEEWLTYVEKDTELALSFDDGPYFAKWKGKSEYPAPWLDWSNGNIYTKNPDAALIDKMVAIARELQASVQGDDGEIYGSGHEAPAFPKPSISDRLRNYLQAMRPAPRIKRTDPPFQVGERVLDAFHKETTVIEIDLESNHGLGKVKVRYDDGREANFMLASSGLSTVAKKNVEECR